MEARCITLASHLLVAVLLCTATLQIAAAGRPTNSRALQQSFNQIISSSSSSSEFTYIVVNGPGISTSSAPAATTTGKKETCVTITNNCKGDLLVSFGWVNTDNGAEYYKGYYQYKKGAKERFCTNSVDPKDGFYVHVDEGPTTASSARKPSGVTQGSDKKLEREGCMFLDAAFTTAYNEQRRQYGSIDDKTGAYTATDKCFLAWFWHVGTPSGEVRLCDC